MGIEPIEVSRAISDFGCQNVGNTDVHAIGVELKPCPRQ